MYTPAKEKTMRTLCKSFVVLLVLAFALPAFAGSITEYSADMVDVKSGRVAQKIAVMPDKVYSESFNAQGKREAISIIRMDQKKMFVFLEQPKSFMELPFDKERFTAADLNMGIVQTKKEPTGSSETVGGYKADKFRVTVRAMGITRTVFEWIAPEFDLPIRTEAEGVILEMRNIKAGRQDAALFENPQGYPRNAALEQMMKGMMGGGSGKPGK
jgi:hypothetical protein